MMDFVSPTDFGNNPGITMFLQYLIDLVDLLAVVLKALSVFKALVILFRE